MDEFLAALVPEPFRVLGKDLKPLSYGHVVLLSRFGCEPVQDIQTLWLATEICSRSFEDGLAFVSEFLQKGKATCMGGSPDIPRAVAAWGNYLAANSAEPQYWDAEGGSSDRGAPGLAQIRVWLLGNCGYSPEYLMDAPWGQCLWDYAASIEERAGYGIVGDKHRAISELLKEARN